MIERRLGADMRGRGGETALVFGEGVGVERVLSRQVLHVDEGVGAGDAGAERGRRLAAVALAVIGVARRGEIGLGQIGPLGPLALGNAPPEPDAIGARRRAEDARQRGALEAGQRIVVGAFLERGDGPDRGGEKRDLARKDVAEEAGDAQGHVDARPAEHGERQDLEAADAVRRHVPGRAAAEQREGLREIVAAGAHRRRAPEVEHDALRPFAVILRIAREHLLGGAAADLPGVAGRGRARIDGEEIAPGRQHVEPAARRRAGRARRHEAPVERAEEAERLGRAAGGDALGNVAAVSASSSSPEAKPSAPSGERPNTCSPSPIRMSLRSQSQASSATSASSGGLPSAAHS